MCHRVAGSGGPKGAYDAIRLEETCWKSLREEGENQLPKPQDFVKANRDNHQLELNDMPAECVCYVMRQLKADNNREDWK